MKKRSTFIVIQLHRSAANQVGLRKVCADRAASSWREATALIAALIEPASRLHSSPAARQPPRRHRPTMLLRWRSIIQSP